MLDKIRVGDTIVVSASALHPVHCWHPTRGADTISSVSDQIFEFSQRLNRFSAPLLPNTLHHLLEDIFDSFLDMAGLRAHPTGPLFPTTRGNSRELGERAMTRIDAARMLKRRLAKAAIVGAYSPHSFRASGLTRFLEEGGT